ncbi:MAG: amidohydrolase family protein [Blastocatellia bacterium]|nr:amidohydrolase family protein [Blastocatellia bacterium]
MIDLHVHFFPESVFQAIWRYFETESHGLWTITYKLFGPEHVAELERQGVERFTSLVYAHKPGLAPFLNDFVNQSQERFPAMIPFGTVFAGDGDTSRTARTIFENYGFYGIKLHPFVSQEDLDDTRFFPVYEAMEGLGKILICHPGSAPVYGKADGPHRLRRVLTRFPRLKTVIAHCGAFEYEQAAQLAEDFEFVYFDTAMIGVHVDVFRGNSPGRDFFLRYRNRIVFGSDFPNIPYAYQDQVAALTNLHLGPEIEAQIFRTNALSLLGLNSPSSQTLDLRP